MDGVPDKKQIKLLIKSVRQTDSELLSAIEARKDDIAQLRRAADQFIQENRKAELESMDVEMLAQGKQGIRVSYLKNAGIHNIYQLSQLSRTQIEALDGIGAQGAAKIYELTKQIVKNSRENLSVRIQADDPDKADDVLVTALYRLVVGEQHRNQFEILYETHHKALMKELALAQKAAGGISWFFASKQEKEAAVQAAESLQQRFAGDFCGGKVLDAYKAVA